MLQSWLIPFKHVQSWTASLQAGLSWSRCSCPVVHPGLGSEQSRGKCTRLEAEAHPFPKIIFRLALSCGAGAKSCRDMAGSWLRDLNPAVAWEKSEVTLCFGNPSWVVFLGFFHQDVLWVQTVRGISPPFLSLGSCGFAPDLLQGQGQTDSTRSCNRDLFLLFLCLGIFFIFLLTLMGTAI